MMPLWTDQSQQHHDCHPTQPPLHSSIPALCGKQNACLTHTSLLCQQPSPAENRIRDNTSAAEITQLFLFVAAEWPVSTGETELQQIKHSLQRSVLHPGIVTALLYKSVDLAILVFSILLCKNHVKKSLCLHPLCSQIVFTV